MDMTCKLTIRIFSAYRRRLLALAVAILSLAVPAYSQSRGRPARIVGTYLSTIVNDQDEMLSRAILTFHQDGTIQSTDSNQAGVPGVFNPFTENAGLWELTSRGGIRASAISFTLPGSEGDEQRLARNDFRARIDPITGTLEGTVELTFYPLTADPNRDVGDSLGVFRWMAQPAAAPAAVSLSCAPSTNGHCFVMHSNKTT
jgi:hypothetical protein